MTTPVFITNWGHQVGTLTTNGAGLMSALSGTGMSIDTATLSPQALKCVVSAAASYAAFNKVTGAGIVVGRVYVYFPTSLPSSSMQFIIGDGTDATFANIRYNSTTGKFEAGNSSQWTAGNVTAQANTSYCIDFRFTWNSTTHLIDWYVNGGTEQPQWSLGSQTSSTFNAIRLGSQTSATGTVLFQHFVLSVTTGDYPIGAGGTQTLKPSGDGTHNAGTNVMEDNAGTDIGTTAAYDKINSAPIDATVYIRQAANGANYAEVTFADITDTHASIIGVQTTLAYTSATTSANRGACMVSKDAFSTSTTVWGDSGTTADYSDGSTANLFYKSAIISGAVDDTTVNALTARVGYSGDTSPNPYWIDLISEVGYVIATNPTGTASITEDADTISASGITTIGASLTQTENADTITTAGTVSVTGSAANTEAADTINAAGTVADAGVTGNSSITENADTLSASSAVSIAASGTNTEGLDTLSASGVSTITGNGAITESVDTLSSAGAGAVAGNASITEAADTISASGTVAAQGGITGSASITENADTLSASGVISVTGSATNAENADTLSASGISTITGTASLTELADTLLGAGAVSVAGNASITEGADTINGIGVVGSVPVSADASINEAVDTINASGTVSVAGTADITEGVDTIIASGAVYTSATLTQTESADTLLAAGYVTVSASASISEIADTILASVRMVGYDPTANRINMERELIDVAGRTTTAVQRDAVSVGRKDVSVGRSKINTRTGD